MRNETTDFNKGLLQNTSSACHVSLWSTNAGAKEDFGEHYIYNIGYPHEERLVFWCKAYSRKIVWGHCHEKEISKQAKEVDPKKISWLVPLSLAILFFLGP